LILVPGLVHVESGLPGQGFQRRRSRPRIDEEAGRP
jgi:hypothetical protein